MNGGDVSFVQRQKLAAFRLRAFLSRRAWGRAYLASRSVTLPSTVYQGGGVLAEDRWTAQVQTAQHQHITKTRIDAYARCAEVAGLVGVPVGLVERALPKGVHGVPRPRRSHHGE